MLGYRLVRGAGPLLSLLRLLVAVSAAGVAVLLLSALGYALERPVDRGEALVRLLWCVVPLAAVASLAAAVPAVDPVLRRRPGLVAVGVGVSRLRLLAAGSAAVFCLAGAGLGLLVFLQLRGELTDLPPHGAATWLPGVGRPLPPGAVVLLVGLPPAVAAVSAALCAPPGRRVTRGQPREAGPVPAPSGLPWGAAAVTAGLAVETVTGALGGGALAGGAGAAPSRLLGVADVTSPGVLGGWLLLAVGMVLAGPGVTHACGRLLAVGRPGALRLLAGRGLQAEAHRVGRPLGALCAVLSGVLAAARLTGVGPGGLWTVGPLVLLGMGLAVVCTAGALVAMASAARAGRETTVTTLRQLGAPGALLRSAAAMRAAVLLAVCAPAVWFLAHLTALPLLH